MQIPRRHHAPILVAVLLAGCATYQQEKADLLRGGGQSQRLIEAQQRLDNARATQLSLQEEQLMAEEELGALQSELRTVNRNRSVQENRLAAARTDAQISAEEEARLRRQLNSQTEEFNEKALQLEGARLNGSDDEIAAKTRELEELKRELARTNREIDVLSGG